MSCAFLEMLFSSFQSCVKMQGAEVGNTRRQCNEIWDLDVVSFSKDGHKNTVLMKMSEPHALRRRELLKAHPELRQCMGSEYKSKYICFGLVSLQLYLAVVTQEWNWLQYVGAVYVLGGTLTQAIFLGIHELSHNLFFRDPRSNHMFAMFCNLPIVFPYCESFRFYHLQHHKMQGVTGIDTDLPSAFESRLFRGKLGKCIWLNFQIIAYALRPILTKPQPVTRYLLYNVAIQLVFDVTLYAMYGLRPFVFLLSSLLVAGGLGFHPTSGHFLSEHYLLNDAGTQETFSYYGPWNWLTWNVGYHVEHHDLPNVPFSRLPRVKCIASEFYDDLHTCKSWTLLPYTFITDDSVTLRSRVQRSE